LLIALGVPAVASNVTNTVALCPGYLGGTLAQLNELHGNQKRLWRFGPAGVLGGVAGGVLLLNTSEHLFRSMAPFLILLAAGLLAVQQPLRAWIVRRGGRSRSSKTHQTLIVLPVALAAVYGGYFGAGLSVIVLAVLGLVLDDSLTWLNALKQILAFGINMAAAIFFLFSGRVIWPVALVMAVGALIGGVLGGRLAGWVRPIVLRWVVVTAGVVIAVLYMV
jgi:uncharacterized membrane protein YfcA